MAQIEEEELEELELYIQSKTNWFWSGRRRPRGIPSGFK